MQARSHLADVRLDATRRAKLWAGVVARRKRRQRLRRTGAVVAALTSVAAAVLAVVLGFKGPEPASAPSATERDTSSLVLADGSQLRPLAGSRMELRQNQPEDVRVLLSRGSVEFDVSHRPGRRFAVTLPAVTLYVVGTRFTVTVAASEQRLNVREGAVEVRATASGELLGRIAAGGSWSGRIDGPEAALPVPHGRPAAPAAHPASSGKPPVARAAEPKKSETAAELFDDASRARRQGRFAEAIAGYEKLLATHPGDRHAQLAAFELGRLKRQRQDPEGAARALEQALEMPQGTPVDEDALAQLVLSYDEARQLAPCRDAQKRYLASYPGGVHAAEIRRRCRGDERK